MEQSLYDGCHIDRETDISNSDPTLVQKFQSARKGRRHENDENTKYQKPQTRQNEKESISFNPYITSNSDIKLHLNLVTTAKDGTFYCKVIFHCIQHSDHAVTKHSEHVF